MVADTEAGDCVSGGTQEVFWSFFSKKDGLPYLLYPPLEQAPNPIPIPIPLRMPAQDHRIPILQETARRQPRRRPTAPFKRALQQAALRFQAPAR